MTRVAGGGSGGGGGSFPPAGTLQIKNGGPSNGIPFTSESYEFDHISGASDDEGNTLIMDSDTAGDYLYAYLEDHDQGGVITPLTLSGFGTFSSKPSFKVLGYDIENDDYWIIFNSNGGSGSITVDTLYPMSLSGTTLTLGSGVTPPVIGGKQEQVWAGVNDGKICMVYIDTGNLRYDTARVYDISGASWAAPAGGNSPYAVNTSAVSHGNSDELSTFATGASNNVSYWNLNTTLEVTCAIKFDFSTETFSDVSSSLPINSGSGNVSYNFTMGIEPNGDYALGTFRLADQSVYIFAYDIVNDTLAILYKSPLTAYRLVIPGDLSNNNIGRIHIQLGSNGYSLKSPFASTSGTGTLAGAECVQPHTSDPYAYGGTGAAIAYNIDAGGWIAADNTPSLWNVGGYKNIMQAYASTLVVIFIVPYYGGDPFRILKPGTIYYTD